MEQLKNPSIYKLENYRVVGAYISEKDQFILETLGNGNISEGLLDWLLYQAQTNTLQNSHRKGLKGHIRP